MIEIAAAKPSDSDIISTLGKETFIESHSASAPPLDIQKYAEQAYNPERVLILM